METRDTQPTFEVREVEYLRLLGYPPGHEPGERVRELMAWARDWYAKNGRPWVYLREAALQNDAAGLRLDDMAFASRRLQEHFQHHDVRGTVLVAASAGRECEEHARQLWNEGKPDEYYFLEIYGSAVVEDIVARTSGRLCDLAGHRGLMAVPHYSPGYTGWDVAEQGKLFELIASRAGQLPGPLEVLSSGMLRPKKSLLAVFGLAPKREGVAVQPGATPCENCGFSPCSYRRAPYRHIAGPASDRTPGAQSQTGPTAPRYTVNPRALRKWATERVSLAPQADGSVEALFRFDGTTCSHQPLAFDYRVRLSGPANGNVILGSSCRPAPGDEGHKLTCSYLADAEDHLHEIAAERPLLGRPLDEVFEWSRESAPAGCHCALASRAHKWGLALEAIHYALAQSRSPQTVS